MELKDVILSTLAELEEAPAKEVVPSVAEKTPAEPQTAAIDFALETFTPSEAVKTETVHSGNHDEEVRMLEGIRERLLVLFEGFQSPNNAQIEAKVDLTLNFLEYLLATIENRLDTIK